MTADKQSTSNGRDRRGRFIKGHCKGFQPGQSGNPEGRPKVVTLGDALRHALNQAPRENPECSYAEIIALVLCEQAVRGNVSAAREIFDRAEGRPRQAIDVDLTVLDWRELARAYGIPEHEVVTEAQRVISESNLGGGSTTVD